MKAITIALVTLLLAAPAAGQGNPSDTLPGSVEDLRALRGDAESPYVHLNGNTCSVPRARSYKVRCWPSRPEHRPLLKRVPWKHVAIVAGTAAFAGFAVHTWVLDRAVQTATTTGWAAANKAATFGGLWSGAAAHVAHVELTE